MNKRKPKRLWTEAEQDAWVRDQQAWQESLVHAQETNRQRLQVAIKARRTGDVCSECERPLGVGAVIYRVRHSFGLFGSRRQIVPVCESCGQHFTKHHPSRRTTCPGCHRAVVIFLRWGQSPFCSARCAWRSHNATRAARLALVRSKHCVSCGGRFQARRRDATTCSHACRTRLYRQARQRVDVGEVVA